MLWLFFYSLLNLRPVQNNFPIFFYLRTYSDTVSRIHGEISAINACTAVFIAKNLTATQIFAAWGELSIYTNAESCPMCASAIRWAGFKGMI